MYEPIDIDTYQDNEVGREVGRKVDDALASLTEIMTPLQLESAGNRRTLDNERSDGLFWEKNMKPFAVIDLDDDLNAIISRRKKRCCREERCALFCLALGISIIGILVFIAKNPVPFETSERAISLKAILSDLHPLHPKAFTWLAQTDVWEPPILNNTSTTNRTHQMWRERYALASIFFSTNGHQWNLKADDSNDGYQIVDWLTSESTVCAWHHVRCRCLMPDDHVPCSGDSEVVSLQLCKSRILLLCTDQFMKAMIHKANKTSIDLFLNNCNCKW